MKLSVFFILPVLACVQASAPSNPYSAVKKALEFEGIIPDIVFTSFTATEIFHLIWPSDCKVILGGGHSPADVAYPPKVVFPHIDSESGRMAAKANYTLAFLDPDADSRTNPTYRSFRHWMISGLRLDGHGTPTTITPYFPPGPPVGTGIHRYTFLLFREPKAWSGIPADSVEFKADKANRLSWNVNTFAARYGLTLVGANYFLSMADSG